MTALASVLLLLASIVTLGFAQSVSLSARVTPSGCNATVRFTATQPSTFTCQLDAGPVVPCSSPKTYYSLLSGQHQIDVVATSILSGFPVETKATPTFAIQKPVVPLRIQGNAKATRKSVIVHFNATMPATFQCQVDANPPSPCNSPHNFSNLSVGKRTLKVQATSKATPRQQSTLSFTVEVRPRPENFRLRGTYRQMGNKVTLLFNATQMASFCCRLNKLSPDPPSTGMKMECVSGKMYRNLEPGVYVAVIEASSIRNDVRSKIELGPVVVSNRTSIPDCTIAANFTGTAGLNINPPSVRIDAKTSQPSNFLCRLNNSLQHQCHDGFIYSELAPGFYTINITAISVCFPHATIKFNTNFTIRKPVDGGWSKWRIFPCNVHVNSSSCGLGVRRRIRSCSNPRLEFGGKTCPGPRTRTASCGKPCNKTITFTITGRFKVSGNNITVFFSSNLPAGYSCRLDGSAPVSCISGVIYRNVGVGKHQIEVQARPFFNRTLRKTLTLTPAINAPPLAISCPIQSAFDSSSSATFKCNANLPQVKYRCSLNGRKFRSCINGTETYTKLKRRCYTVTVEASRSPGEIVTETVMLTPMNNSSRCQVYICALNVGGTNATIVFVSDDPGATFQCRVNSQPFFSCNSSLTLASLPPGNNKLIIRPRCSSSRGKRIRVNLPVP